MLNISPNSINSAIRLQEFKSYQLIRKNHISRLVVWLFSLLLLILFLVLFMPWTQNLRTKGYVTTRSPQQRPQAIQSVLAGRIEKWYVQEGDFVEKGDTIVFISEIKSEYFDPEILERTSRQVNAKSQSIEVYDEKINALQGQSSALREGLDLKRKQVLNKILQAENKIKMDSIDLQAYEANLYISENQLERTKELFDQGLKSLTELQEKEYKVQEMKAKTSVQQNKLINQKNELLNLQLELSATERDYADKISKSESDRQSAVSDKLQSIAETAKLENLLSNYTERQKFYHITAPQSGYITKSIKKGLGETIKEGTDIVTIVPAEYDLAVELYVKPQDIPLLSIGNDVQLRFDGWPAIVISGWPESSTGVFQGHVVAIDRYISDNGNYRILVSPENKTKPWPAQLSIGTGVQAFLLLKEVPIWYEIWRQLNGFPPDFYQAEAEMQEEVKRKAPLKSVK